MPVFEYQHARGRCEVVLQPGVLAQAARRLRERFPAARAAVVTDETVNALYGERLRHVLRGGGMEAEVIAVPPGEQSKSAQRLEWLYARLCAAELTRSDVIVAFGGGVPGDLAGFAAATYMRGLPLVQIPTTLLAQVDSALGGKTGINLFGVKNLIGAFWHPALVLADPDLLISLPAREVRGGFAEIIKAGAIADKALFDALSAVGPDLSPQELTRVIARACEIKLDAVCRDERDTGRRAMLNFGHTLGHAYERASGHACSHGEAVAAGMCAMARVGERMGLTAPGTEAALRARVTAFGLPDRLDADAGALRAAIAHDKKRAGDTLRVVLLREIGQAFVQEMTPDALVALAVE